MLETYQPPAASDDEIAAAVADGRDQHRRHLAKDMGKVMKAVMAALAGKTVDGRRVNELVRARLAP